jgi:hypothetical protein
MPAGSKTQSEKKTWVDGLTTHTTWEEEEVIYIDPYSQLASGIFQEAGIPMPRLPTPSGPT